VACGERLGEDWGETLRPTGVQVFALLNGTAGLLGLAATGSGLHLALTELRGPAPAALLFGLAFCAAVALALLGVAYGLLRLYPWARSGSIACSGTIAGLVFLGAVGMGINLFSGHHGPKVGALVVLAVVSAAVISYFVAQLVYMRRASTQVAFMEAAVRRGMRMLSAWR
jgi:hypothetical protein